MIRMKSPGEHRVYAHMRNDAKRRGYTFDISLQWFIKAIHEPCHYCGSVDQNKKTFMGGKLIDGTRKPTIKDFRYNGLDRKDNNLGYSEHNCLPCCIICNKAKRTMKYDDFMEWLRQAALHNAASCVII